MCCCELQLEFPAGNISDLIARTRATGLLPFEWETASLTATERTEVAQAFLAGARDCYDRLAAKEREEFARRGWPFRWFQRWQPVTAADEALSETIEEALHVIDQYYSRIVERGLAHSEDMGLLQAKGRGGSEGVAVKREAYGRNVLVSVHCVTGPTNFDPSTGELEFEAGAKSRVLHLVYGDLPTAERLSGDIAAFPVITASNNQDGSVAGGVWMSEGWVGKHSNRPRRHRPWDTITEPKA